MTTPDDNFRWQNQVTTAPATHLTSYNGDNDRDDTLDDNIQMTT
jgi:hypothetical protein